MHGVHLVPAKNPDIGRLRGGLRIRALRRVVRIKRLYPEQEARAEFPLQGPRRIYAYGATCGLIELS